MSELSYTMKGKLILVGDVQEFDSGFKKRDIVIETYGDYPQQVKFELHKDNVDKANIDTQTPIEVEFNVRGREWEGRYFTNLVAWRIKADMGQVTTHNVHPQDNDDDFF